MNVGSVRAIVSEIAREYSLHATLVIPPNFQRLSRGSPLEVWLLGIGPRSEYLSKVPFPDFFGLSGFTLYLLSSRE